LKYGLLVTGMPNVSCEVPDSILGPESGNSGQGISRLSSVSPSRYDNTSKLVMTTSFDVPTPLKNVCS